MHFYEFNIKSYHAETAHLTPLQDLAFRRMLDHYYDTEQPLATDLPRLSHRLRLAQPDVEFVLSEFFELREDGYHNDHCDEKIAKYRAFIERQRSNASKKNQSVTAKKSHRKATAKPPLSSGSQPLPTTQEQLPNNQEKTSQLALVGADAPADCPHEEIIRLYHEIIPEMPAVKIWSEKRKKLLRARWKENPKRQRLAWWEKYFRHVRESDFLMGRSSKFQANLEWLLNSENLIKVIEGNYHRGGEE